MLSFHRTEFENASTVEMAVESAGCKIVVSKTLHSEDCWIIVFDGSFTAVIDAQLDAARLIIDRLEQSDA